MKEFDTEKHRSLTLQLYVVFIISILMGLIPSTVCQIMGIVFFVALIITVPIYLYSSEDGSFLRSHMAYLNTTIWWGSTFVLIGAIIMGLWIWKSGDRSMLEALSTQVNNGTMVSEAQIEGAMADFFSVNMGLLIKSGLICVGPPTLYVLMRTLKGLMHALGSERIG